MLYLSPLSPQKNLHLCDFSVERSLAKSRLFINLSSTAIHCLTFIVALSPGIVSSCPWFVMTTTMYHASLLSKCSPSTVWLNRPLQKSNEIMKYLSTVPAFNAHHATSVLQELMLKDWCMEATNITQAKKSNDFQGLDVLFYILTSYYNSSSICLSACLFPYSSEVLWRIFTKLGGCM